MPNCKECGQWVKDKTLEEKFRELIIKDSEISIKYNTHPGDQYIFNSLSQIAKEHYLEVFDKWSIEIVDNTGIDIDNLRKRLEEM